MKVLMLIASLMFVVSCAHKGGHGHSHHGKKSGCSTECKSKKWKKMDANKDGKVSKDEFIKMKTSRFAEMDSNKDGSVTMEEKKAWKAAKKKSCKSCGS